MFNSLLLIITVTLSVVLNAQHTVSGTVRVKGERHGWPGINILEKGTEHGTVTDSLGNFSFTVSDGNDTLYISFVGLRSTEVPLRGRHEVMINTKIDCNVDFFDSQAIDVYLSSGVVN